MESESQIIVRRYEYEEPYNTQLEFLISNGKFSATIKVYFAVEDIQKIGEALAIFPKKMGDEYRYVYGSENHPEEFDKFFLMRAYMLDNSGHCALQFKANLNQAEPSEGESIFSLHTEPAAINRLGKLFITFSKLEHKEFQWSANKNELFEEYQKHTEKNAY